MAVFKPSSVVGNHGRNAQLPDFPNIWLTFLCFVGGVGFDINCGVRLLRTNLDESDVQPVKEQLAQAMFDHIPVGVGSKGVIPMNAK